MAQISEIQVKELLKYGRMDSEYFDPYLVRLETYIDSIDSKSIDSLGIKVSASAFYPSIADDYGYEGIPFLRVADIKELSITNSFVRIFSNVVDKHKTILRAKAGDIVITKGGTVANVAILPENKEGYSLCRDLILLKTSSSPLRHLVLFFLASDIGRKLLDRDKSQQVQAHLTLPKIRKTKIPLLDAKYFSEIYEKYIFKKQKSKDLYFQAEQLLLKELGLEDFEAEWVVGYESDRDSVLDFARMDAEFFQPRYELVSDKIRKVEYDKLGNLVTLFKKGIEVGSDAYVDEGVPFLRVSNIGKLGIDNTSAQYIEEDLFDSLKDKFCPKKGEILLSKDGTPGIAYLLNNDIETIISGGLVRLKSNGVESEYLTLVLNSLIVQSQIEQNAGGALIKHWRPDQIKETLIPIVPGNIRTEIVKLIKESFSALKESRELLEQAKREVEEMIESKSNA